MKVAIVKERRDHETRVAATPESVKKLIGLGAEVVVETGAGEGPSISDKAYEDAGAKVARDEAAALEGADVVLKVRPPMTGGDGGADEIGPMKKGAVLVGLLAPFTHRDEVEAYAKHGIDAFAMELLPRITRAQTMDALSSQSNLAGYKAVVDAAAEFGRAFPMMMTAAGTVPPARVVVLGAGVAGLQAIATARRLGAVVSAFDVRPAVKEEVESLGAKFIEVEPPEGESGEAAGGYAKEMGEEYKRRQSEKIREALQKNDIAISTALIPGKPAPTLITADMVEGMKPGSVIVDLAVEAGGNCELSEFDKVVVKHGVKILGHANLPGRIAADSSSLYARNLVAFLALMIDEEKKELGIDWDDEIVKATCLTRDGAVVNPALTVGEDS